MAQLLNKPSFEGAVSPAWTLLFNAATSGAKARTGSQSIELSTSFGGAAPGNVSEIRQLVTDSVPGETYDVEVFFNSSDAGPDGSPSVRQRLELQVEDDFGGWTTVDSYTTADDGPDDFTLSLSASFVPPTLDPFEIRLKTVELNDPGFGAWIGTVRFWVDDFTLDGLSREELLSRANMSTYLDNLKALIEGIDPNIGTVFLAERRWSQDRDLVDDGAVLNVSPGGLFDGVDDLGPATRFWILEPHMTISPLTTCSSQWQGHVSVLGFYGWKENHAQAEILRDVALEILATLNTKTAELTTLAAGMGLGYLGYLETFPAMAGKVRAAQLIDPVVQGHVTQLSAGYFEEVSRD